MKSSHQIRERTKKSYALLHPRWFYFTVWAGCTSWYWLIDHLATMGNESMSLTLGWQALYGSQAIASLVMALRYFRKSWGYEPARAMDWPLTTLMMLAMLLVAFPLGISTDLRFAIAVTLGGIYVSWIYLRWGCALGWSGVFDLVAVFYLNDSFSPIVKTALHAMPAHLSLALAIILPIVNLLGMRATSDEMRRKEATPNSIPAHLDRKTSASLAKMGICISAFSFIGSMLVESMGIGNGPTSPSHYAVWQLSEMVIAISIFCWVFVKGSGISFTSLWKGLLSLLGLVFLLEATGWHTELSDLVAYGFVDAMWSLAMIPLLDFGKRARINPAAMTSGGRALYSAFFFMGALFSRAVGISGLTAEISLVMLLPIMFTVLFCVDSNDERLQEVMLDLSASQPVASEYTTIDRRCQEIGEKSGLSDREIEVACYLAKGRTRAYIADSLCISQNTVKGHTRHVYEKLGIHSRQELQSMVGVD